MIGSLIETICLFAVGVALGSVLGAVITFVIMDYRNRNK
jgi:hypothetical protein